jgi:hypothetical protein
MGDGRIRDSSILRDAEVEAGHAFAVGEFSQGLSGKIQIEKIERVAEADRDLGP